MERLIDDRKEFETELGTGSVSMVGTGVHENNIGTS
jgi:hypothetical protein